MSQQPTFVVAACVVRKEEVLLAQRNQPRSPSAHLRWELPGGKVNLEESPHDALAREIQEELGAKIEIVRLLPHVQSNIYATETGKIHSIVLAFESVLSRHSDEPRPADPSVSQVKWVLRGDIEKFDLLPGTRQFIACLDRLDRASYSANQFYIRLERTGSTGLPVEFWELRSVYDLWSSITVIERYGNLRTRSSRYQVKRDIPEQGLIRYLNNRIRSLAKHGYKKVSSDDDARLALGF